MRILVLSWRDPEHPFAGGAETYVDEIGRRWVGAGHEVRWLCGRAAGQSRELRRHGMEIRRQGKGYGVYPASAWDFLRHHRGWADVIVDAENGIPFFSPFYTKTPKVLLMHHVHREVFHRELPPGVAHLGEFLEGRLMPWAYRRDWFVAVSEGTRSELVELGVDDTRVAVIHNGLDAETYIPPATVPPAALPAETGPTKARPAKAPVALWVGRLRSYKTVSTLLDAARLCRPRYPELRWQVAGEGPERERLQRAVESMGLQDIVEILGFVTTEEKVRLMQNALLVVQTSMKEGWGMTVIEANACGTAVVASDVPGLRDSVRDGETGLLVPWADPQALADGVLHLVDHPQLRARFERNALSWASRFRWQYTADRWLNLLEARQRGGSVPSELRHCSLSSERETIPQPAA